MAAVYEVEARIIYATNLFNINWPTGGVLKPYAEIWVEPGSRHCTRADNARGTSPWWGHLFHITFNTPIAGSNLYIKIKHDGPADGIEPFVGSAELPLSDVVRRIGLGNPDRTKYELDLKRPNGCLQGKVHVAATVLEIPVAESEDEEEIEY